VIHSVRCPRNLNSVMLNSVMERYRLLDCFPASEDRFLVVSGCFELTVDLATLKCSSGEFKTANGLGFMLVHR
jgi:hypothetical protein